jgi:hypothetical protein
MKRLLLLVGVLLIIAAGVWKFGFSHNWTNRYNDQWLWEVKTLGKSAYPDETGNYAEGTTLKDDPIHPTTRTVTAETSEAPVGQVLLSDYFESRNAVTNEIEWQFTSTAFVDAATGRHASGDFDGDYYFFPRHVDKTSTYVISNASYRSLPMTFQQEEVVAGVTTYLFAFHGDFDNTDANASYVTLEPNQVVTCFDFSLEYWVEPVTGEIVKYREWCEGDWIVDQTTGERVSTISRWGGETSGDDIIRQVTNVQNRKLVYMWASLYGPGAGLLLGVALVGANILVALPRKASSEPAS